MRGAAALVVFLASVASAAEPITVYSGRNEKLVGALFKAFEKETGTKVKVRYGETPALAATLLEEGERSPADLYVSQDAGALGALSKAGRLAVLPPTLLAKVPDARFKSPKGDWVGLSGRARVVAYNTQKVKQEELPSSVSDLTKPRWRGRIGWAPTNASFQSFVTAMRLLQGEEATVAWLRAMKASEPRIYKNNMAIVEALGRGEIDLGLVNHYYVYAANKKRKEPLPVAIHFLAKGDAGALINVAGVGILKGAKNEAGARALVEFLLSPKAQAHFANETYEYPVVPGVPTHAKLKSITEIGSPELDLSRLDDLQGTVALLQKEGIL